MPEVTANFIRIPIRTCEITATITISAKQGILALYCGKIKKIGTYLFDRRAPHNWTMKRAQAWVQRHKNSILCQCPICNAYYLMNFSNENEIPDEAFKCDLIK